MDAKGNVEDVDLSKYLDSITQNDTNIVMSILRPKQLHMYFEHLVMKEI